MSEEKKPGKWLKLPLEELDKRMPKETPRMQRERSWQSIKKVLKFLGIGTGGSRTITGCRGHIDGGHMHHTPSQDFRASHRVETPTPPSYDDLVRREIAVHQYIRDTDGIPNDYQDGHEH